MKVFRKGDGVAYEAARHFKCRSVHLVESGKDSQKLNVGVTEFLQGGGAEMSASNSERYYHVLSGSLSVRSETDDYTLHEGDGIYIFPHETRAILNHDTDPCTILVIIVNPD